MLSFVITYYNDVMRVEVSTSNGDTDLLPLHTYSFEMVAEKVGYKTVGITLSADTTEDNTK